MPTRILPAAILAGGLATRLRPVTEKIPKSLVEIAGEPFIAHQLRLLHSRGLRRVVLCIGYLGEMIEDYLGNGAAFGVEVSYSPDGAQLRGTAGAIAQARHLLGDRFFVVYGDSYLPCDYTAVQTAFEAGAKPALMTVYPNGDRWDSSNVEFAEGRILNYDKKNRTSAMRYIDYGLGVFEASCFDAIPPQGTHDLASLYQDLLRRDLLTGCEVTQRFYETGSFQGIEELSAYLKQGLPE